MFDVFADEICFDRIRVARFEPGVPATIRDNAAEWLSGTNPPGFISEEEHEKTIREIEEEAEERGREGGRAEREHELEEQHAQELAAEKALAFKEGKLAAAEAIGKAEDVARVDALLARVALAEAKLRGALNGVQDDRYEYRKIRQLKPAEFKAIIRECFLTLWQARAEFTRG